MIGTWLCDCSICCSARCRVACTGDAKARRRGCRVAGAAPRGRGAATPVDPAAGRLGSPRGAGWTRTAAVPSGLARLVAAAGDAAAMASRPGPAPLAWGALSATRFVNCGFAGRLGYRAAALTAASEAIQRAAQTRLPHLVPIHPAARAARPRGTPPRTSSSWSSATSSPCCAARPHDPGSNPPIGHCSPRSAARCHEPAGPASW
jgi:hypothetical protein